MNAINLCCSTIDPHDSYGLIACQLARHLTAMGVKVNLFWLRPIDDADIPEDIRRIIEQPIQTVIGGVLLGYPTLYGAYPDLAAHDAARKIALTMFESTKLPDGWVEPLNRCAATIVPSTFCKDIFEASGVQRVTKAPLGINEAFQFVRRASWDERMTFLTFLDRGMRKGGYHAIEAFYKAFGDRSDVELICKMRGPKDGEEPLQITNPNIHVIADDMSEDELFSLYCRCHALINPNLGEGFGLIPREFAATGGIALTSEWGGTADDIDQWAWGLPVNVVPATWADNRRLSGQSLGEWAQPDTDVIARILRVVRAEPEGYFAKTFEHSQNVRRLYSWRRLAETVWSIWRGSDGHQLGDGRFQQTAA